MRKQEVDKATYEERIERLLEQMTEVEEELNKMKDKQKTKNIWKAKCFLWSSRLVIQANH